LKVISKGKKEDGIVLLCEHKENSTYISYTIGKLYAMKSIEKSLILNVEG
jgi:hypothetical protein